MFAQSSELINSYSVESWLWLLTQLLWFKTNPAPLTYPGLYRVPWSGGAEGGRPKVSPAGLQVSAWPTECWAEQQKSKAAYANEMSSLASKPGIWSVCIHTHKLARPTGIPVLRKCPSLSHIQLKLLQRVTKTQIWDVRCLFLSWQLVVHVWSCLFVF